VFRPRLLVYGMQGMGQQYLGGALLSKFEGLHVQSFDLASLMEDSTMSPEATVVRLFKEVRRHKPSVIYIPNVDVWYQTVGPAVIKTFTTLLRSIPPNDPILLLGVLETATSHEKLDPSMLRDLFGFSQKNMFKLKRPDAAARSEYFNNVIGYIRMSPKELPTGENRKKRQLEELEVAPEPKSLPPTKEDTKRQEKRDRMVLNQVKIWLQPIMDMIKQRYKMFRHSPIDEKDYQYLIDEMASGVLTTDIPEEQQQEQALYRPYEIAYDNKGVRGLKQVATGLFFYNVNSVLIEERLVNGRYIRFKDFLDEIKRLEKDAAKLQDFGDTYMHRYLKAAELKVNVEVDVANLETQHPEIHEATLDIHERKRQKELKAQSENPGGSGAQGAVPTVTVPTSGSSSGQPSAGLVADSALAGPLPPGSPSGRRNSQASAGGSPDNSHGQSNGSTFPSRPDEDVQMSGTDPPYTPSAAAHNHPRPSQEGPHTQINKNFRPSDYHNSASTTSSGQKTSDRSSGAHHPDLASMFTPGGSQLPDTQSDPFSQSNASSQAPQLGGTQHGGSDNSQNQAPPRTGNLASILNEPNGSPSNGVHHTTTATTVRDNEVFTQPLPPLVLNEELIVRFHQELVHRTSGLSVEQLEQVNAAIMDAVWQSRGSWNRTTVLVGVQQAFNETISDIEMMQRILPHSQEDDENEGNATQFSAAAGPVFTQAR
jgi:ATPase family AAA domain-containing protein 2